MLPDQVFDNLDFDSLAETLADGLLASYLLATSHVREETEPGAASFADPIELGFDVTPSDAVEYFKRKQVVTRKQFDLLSEDARAAAFTVAGVYKTDILEGFKSEIAGALETGTAQGIVIKRFREILAGAGHQQLGAFHLETVFRTNMQVAYGVGRRRSLEEVAEDLPHWQYHSAGDDRVRPEHAVLNGIILPANHEFWNAHFPPWGFNCRCSVTATDSIPDDYDHKNPSGLGEIIYDNRGNPAKAEYETSVIDLAAAGQLPGISPQGKLKTVIEEGVKRARKAREKEPEKTALGKPVSQALVVSAPDRFMPPIARALSVIDQVHGDGDLPIITLARERILGDFRKASGLYLSAHPRRISINTSAKQIELTTVHEIGHFLDDQGIGKPGQMASMFDDRMEPWRQAVERSQAIQELLAIRHYGGVPAILRGQPVLVEVPTQILDYLLHPAEVWARSYAQFVTRKRGNRVVQRQLDNIRQQIPGRLYLPYQWEDDDFQELYESIDSLMRTLEWMK